MNEFENRSEAVGSVDFGSPGRIGEAGGTICEGGVVVWGGYRREWRKSEGCGEEGRDKEEEEGNRHHLKVGEMIGNMNAGTKAYGW